MKIKIAKPRNRAPQMTLGEGAKPYDQATIQLLARLAPQVEIVHPLGIETETDMDRLARARGMARANRRAYGAIIRIEVLTTKYFQELVLGEAHELHVMRSKTTDVTGHKNPFGTVIVVYKPGHQDRIENGLCPIYWERTS